MTDLRARLAGALRQPLRYLSVCNPSSPKSFDEQCVIVSEHLADILLSLSDVAIVELPEPNDGTDWHIQDVGSVSVNSAFCGGGVRLLNVFDSVTTPAEACQYAAALLAAANAAEQAAP